MKERDLINLCKNLDYDKATGKLFWIDGSNNFKGRQAGWLTGDGYRNIEFNGSTCYAHRVVLYMHQGYINDEVDHINHNRDDNRLENLRDATREKNTRNLSMMKNNTSGFNGVQYIKDREIWRSVIRINRKSKHLGYFDNLIDAVAARISANKKYNFHENHGFILKK